LPVFLADRTRIVILSFIGSTDGDIAKLFGLHPNSARNWRLRFNAEGLDRLLDAPRSDRRKVHDHDKITHDKIRNN
jgi:transposase